MLSVKGIASIPRWCARGLSLIVLGFLSLFLFGEWPPPVSILHVCFPFGVMLGLILAWFFEGIGATITILSIAAFYSIHFLQEGTLRGGPYFLISGIPSIFFLASVFLQKKTTSNQVLKAVNRAPD